MYVKTLVSCLRKVANSDVGKKGILKYHVLEIVHRLLRSYGLQQSDGLSFDTNVRQRVHVVKHSLAILAAMSLRNKLLTSRMFIEGYFTTIVEVIRFHAHNSSIGRQGCLLIRNCAVHGMDYKVYLSRIL